MKIILATAYAMNPYKGSEDGTGWNLVEQIARFNQVIAVTRKNNKPFIDQYMQEHPSCVQSSRVTFLYFDLPYWMMFWKKGERGAMLYFYLWQMFMPLFIWRNKLRYDLLHNLNFHNDWTPTFLWLLNKPLVWGPVGHHPKIPSNYIKEVYGIKEYVKSRALWLIKKIFWNMDPFLKLALWNTDAVITMNSGVEKVHRIEKRKLHRMPAVGAEQPMIKERAKDKFTFLCVGRLVAMKGFDLTLAAFARFYNSLEDQDKKNVQLKIVGKGPLLDAVKLTIQKLGLAHAVVVQEWVQKDQMPDIYASASAFFFPSHEGAGMVVPEALSYGLPVVCFDNEGPGEFIDDSCGIKIPYSSHEASVSQFAEALGLLYHNKSVLEELSKGAVRKFDHSFKWDVKGDVLKNIYATFN